MFRQFQIRLSIPVVLNCICFYDGLEVDHQRIAQHMKQLLSHIGSAITLGVRNLAFSSIAWTSDFACTWEMFSWGEGGFGDSS